MRPLGRVCLPDRPLRVLDGDADEMRPEPSPSHGEGGCEGGEEDQKAAAEKEKEARKTENEPRIAAGLPVKCRPREIGQNGRSQ